MKVVIQRVKQAAVSVAGKTVGEISHGLLVFCGIAATDTEDNLKSMADKIWTLRVFANEEGKFHYSVADVQGGVLLIPQFTLFADTSKGRRPDFFGAMKPPEASSFFDLFVEQFESRKLLTVQKGVFGASMEVSSVNDGPVTIIIEN